VESIRRPVGPRSSVTYWRRRIIVLAVLLLVMYLIIRACGSSGDNPAVQTDATQEAGNNILLDTSPSTTATPAPVSNPQNGNVSPATSLTPPSPPPASERATPPRLSGNCTPEDIRVLLQSEKRIYQENDEPIFRLSVINISEKPCTMDVGKKAFSLAIKSGNDSIWTTAHCPLGPQSDVRKLAPDELITQTVTWSRVRSQPGCSPKSPKKPEAARPGTYVISGAVSKFPSAKQVFDLS